MVWSSEDVSYTLVENTIYEDATTNKPNELTENEWNDFITAMNNVSIHTVYQIQVV
jgi:hypothetical protein